MNNISLIMPSNTLLEKNKLFILNNENSSSITYIDDNNNTVNLSNESNIHRPIYISELNKKLKNRDWNITERKYIKNDILMLETDTPSGWLNEINSNTSGIKVCNDEINSEDMSNFREEYKEILDTMLKNEIYFYNSSKNTIDILNNKNNVIIDIIPYVSDTYTDTINLNILFNQYPYEEINKKIDLVIQYSKYGKLFSKDLIFSISENQNYYLEYINNEVAIEYNNNIIKAYSLVNDIDECIINNCTITYEERK